MLKRQMLEKETCQTLGHVMDSAFDQETFLKTCVLCRHRQRAPQPLRCLQCLCVSLFTTMNNNEITVITMLMLMMVCIFEAVILTEV